MSGAVPLVFRLWGLGLRCGWVGDVAVVVGGRVAGGRGVGAWEVLISGCGDGCRCGGWGVGSASSGGRRVVLPGWAHGGVGRLGGYGGCSRGWAMAIGWAQMRRSVGVRSTPHEVPVLMPLHSWWASYGFGDVFA